MIAVGVAIVRFAVVAVAAIAIAFGKPRIVILAVAISIVLTQHITVVFANS